MNPLLRALLRLVAIVVLAAGLSARAQDYQGRKLVSPSLIADTAAVVAGKPFTVGVLLKMEPGWHTYWQFGGDSGAPTKIDWELPEGFKAGAIQWPLPTARPDEGDQLTYIYENETMLLVEVIPPANLPAGEVSLKAKLRWLVCKETCIPGDGEVSLSLATTGDAAPANAELFAKWRAKLPKNSGSPFTLEWSVEAKNLQLQVAGVPADFNIEFFPLPPNNDVTPGHPKVSGAAVDGTRTIAVPFQGELAGAVWQGVLVTQKEGAPREGWMVSSAPASSKTPATSSAVGMPLPKPDSLLHVLWLAFLGGLILNLMPCVLPVIALKIFGFIQQAGEAPERVFRLGLAFVAGVFTFFFALAALVVAFEAAGHGLNWGFQFQNPYLLSGLIALVFIFALSMFGVFEITIGSGAATTLDKLAHREGYAGAFTHGLFTTLLGTSCTAPLLGPVLGFAFAQPPHIVFLVFGVLAAGMSLPYFLLTWQPQWMRFLPKPGAWMERMKQLMGFVLLAVVVWLLGVLGESRGIEALVAVSSFLIVVGIAAWIYGFARSAVASILVLALIAGGWLFFLRGKLDAAPSARAVETTSGKIAWQPFTPAALSAAIERGEAVFIDFTASWCLNCKYNERFVLETDPVRAAFRAHQIVPFKADWTNNDPDITALLKKFGRIGVPAYVLYPRGAEPIVLPEILTQGTLLDAIAANLGGPSH